MSDYADTALQTQPDLQDALSGSPNRLEPMLVRLPPQFASELRSLAKRTRVRQSDYLREAVADLLAKYGQLPERTSP